MPVGKQLVNFPIPGSYLVFKIMNYSFWICSKSLMPYSIQFINNYKFLLQPLLGPAFLLFFLSPTKYDRGLHQNLQKLLLQLLVFSPRLRSQTWAWAYPQWCGCSLPAGSWWPLAPEAWTCLARSHHHCCLMDKLGPHRAPGSSRPLPRVRFKSTILVPSFICSFACSCIFKLSIFFLFLFFIFFCLLTKIIIIF